MTIAQTRFVQLTYEKSDEWLSVCSVADALIQHIQLPETIEALKIANKPRASSASVQEILLSKALSLGFVDESKGLFASYKNSRLRPDYFLRLENNTGILFEVERGKTNQNNMDFLDFWKCHICKHAHYLFLCVPVELRQNDSGKLAGRPYKTAVGHMQSFFDSSNYTNVRGVVVFGY